MISYAYHIIVFVYTHIYTWYLFCIGVCGHAHTQSLWHRLQCVMNRLSFAATTCSVSRTYVGPRPFAAGLGSFCKL